MIISRTPFEIGNVNTSGGDWIETLPSPGVMSSYQDVDEVVVGG